MSKLGLKLLVLGALIAAALGIVACGDSSNKEGGTLTGSYASFPDYLDPQLSYTQEGWTAMYDTYLPLLTYKRANGEEGSEVVPALAEDMPEISSDGKTYELTLRKGLKYSDGKPVKASDFKSSMERMFKINSPGFYYYESIVGAEKFAETKQGGIPGIEADDATGKITIELTAPRGTFTNELGMLFAAVLPAGTPARNLTADPPPATGPYVITKSEPGRSWSYERNPYWAKANSQIEGIDAGNFDKVELNVVRNDSTIVNDVESDKTMWMQPLVPSDQRQRIVDKYEGTQFRVEYPINSYLFWMNTDKAPFDDVKVRQAVNYAVDSAALERIYAGSLGAMRQILPDGMPGHDEELDLYPHNMAKAKQLFEEANPSDTDITVWTNDENPNDEAGAYYQDVLSDLGFNAKLKTINADNYYAILGNERTPDLDTGWLAWLADYPNPNNYFQPLLSGEAIAPTNNTNFARIDVPELNKRITKLSEEPLGPEQTEEYRKLNREFMELAPWAPYGTNTISTFVNSEIDLDKVVYNPTFGHSLTSFELK